MTEKELQSRFRLLEPFKYKDKIVRAIDYIADFKYIDNEGVEFMGFQFRS